jgi:acetyl-CoA acetyltransferase
MAGVGPDDIHTAEVHDATAFGELAQSESLAFCKEGEGGPYAESGITKLGGSRPLNPSGGLECRGHPIGATGLAQIAEIVYQLRGDAGERQVEGARLGLTENGGGFISNGEAAVAIHILEGPPRLGGARR